MNVQKITDALKASGISAWLLYDFQGMNMAAVRLAGLEGKMLTRRWFCLVTSAGEVTWLVASVEAGLFNDVAGKVVIFASWADLLSHLKTLLDGTVQVAMEYDRDGMIPHVSRVDAGTLNLVQATGTEVVSSAALLQWAEARWSDGALSLHKIAAEQLLGIKEDAFAYIRKNLREEKKITEHSVQNYIEEKFDRLGLVTNHPPIVAVGANAGNPHYAPTQESCRPIKPGDLILIDLWAKRSDEKSVYADITWMAYAGNEVPKRYRDLFEVIARARDAALAALSEAAAQGRNMLGFEVDDIARSVVVDAGYGDSFIHRTGHNIGTDDHGIGANIDNLETHDARELIPGLGFSIEPGIYLSDCGLRTECNVYRSEERIEVTTLPLQSKITPLFS